MLAKVKLSCLSKIFTQRTFQRVSKLCCLQRGYANLKNYGYFEVIKQSACNTKILAPRKVYSKNEEVFLLSKKKETSIFNIIWEIFSIINRIIVITAVISGLLIYYWFTRLFGIKTIPVIYLKAIEFLGPTFIKLGQWMSTRRDLYPEELCLILSRLQRGTSAHSWYYTRQMLEAAYGTTWRRCFAEFEPEPVGSGCCAQVHKALLDINALVEVKRDARVSALVESKLIFFT